MIVVVAFRWHVCVCIQNFKDLGEITTCQNDISDLTH